MSDYDAFFRSHPELVLEPRDAARFEANCVVRDVEKASVFLHPGSKCEYLPLILEGSLKVYKTSDNGREITLYRIGKGQSCILSALGILNDREFPAIAETETRVKVVLVPGELLRQLVGKYPGWTTYLFTLYQARFDAVLALIDEVLFRKVDVRIADFLVSSRGILTATHQDVATELGTSREVVSRILKEFERRGLVRLGRGRIEVIDPETLIEIAGA